MDIGPRQAAFLASEMEKIESDDERLPSEKREAHRIRERAEADLLG